MRQMNSLLSSRVIGAAVSQVRGCHIMTSKVMGSTDLRANHVFSRNSSTSKVSRNRVAYEMKHEELYEEEAEWLWPVDDTQKTFIAGHRAGARYTGPYITLNSAKPLRIEDVEEALFHTQRKTPIYHVQTEERDGQLWWQKKDTFDISFKVMEQGLDFHEVVRDVWADEGLDVDGSKPIWTSRLIPAANDAPCPMPELKAAFPYQYNFFSTTHHAVGDGTTVAVLSQAFLNVLNAVIDGRKIDSKPFGIFMSNEDIARQDLAFRDQLLADPRRFEALRDEVLTSNKSPTLLKAFPKPNVERPSSVQIINNIDKATHKRILSKCQEEGVSFGSAMQSVINTAIVEMVREAGIDDEYHDISVNVAADLRRHMQRTPLIPFGLHARTMAQLSRTPKNARDHFWEYARDVHNDFSAKIKAGGVLQQEVARQMVMPRVDPTEFYAGSPEVIRDYGFNNIGDLTRVIPGEGKHVQMTELLQLSAVHKFIYPIFHQMLTFRGSCKYVISYATDCFTHETAMANVKKVNEILNEVCK